MTTDDKKTVKKDDQTADKKTVMKDFGTHAKDTGSAPVQIALLTQKINALSEHLKTHKKDKHSRKGLLGMVGRRRRLLRYLQQRSAQAYADVTKKLGLRK